MQSTGTTTATEERATTRARQARRSGEVRRRQQDYSGVVWKACKKCQNHGLLVRSERGHASDCPHRACDCSLCLSYRRHILLKKRRLHAAAVKAAVARGAPPPLAPCERCGNHGERAYWDHSHGAPCRVQACLCKGCPASAASAASPAQQQAGHAALSLCVGCGVHREGGFTPACPYLGCICKLCSLLQPDGSLHSPPDVNIVPKKKRQLKAMKPLRKRPVRKRRLFTKHSEPETASPPPPKTNAERLDVAPPAEEQSDISSILRQWADRVTSSFATGNPWKDLFLQARDMAGMAGAGIPGGGGIRVGMIACVECHQLLDANVHVCPKRTLKQESSAVRTPGTLPSKDQDDDDVLLLGTTKTMRRGLLMCLECDEVVETEEMLTEHVCADNAPPALSSPLAEEDLWLCHFCTCKLPSQAKLAAHHIARHACDLPPAEGGDLEKDDLVTLERLLHLFSLINDANVLADDTLKELKK